MQYQNTYLDGHYKKGRLSENGQKLNRIEFPHIQTSFLKVEEKTDILLPKNPKNLVDFSKTEIPYKKQGITVSNIITTSNLLPNSDGESWKYSTSSVSNIPTTPGDIYNQLERISSDRSGAKNRYFSLQELKEIAKVLNIQSNIDKQALAENIKKTVTEWKVGTKDN